MKIVHVTDAFAPVMGGIETQVAALAFQQAVSGDDVTVLTTTMQHPRRGVGISASEKLVRDNASDEVPYRVIRSEWPNPAGFPVDPRAAKRFEELIGNEQPDVVHIHVGELTPVATHVLLRLQDSTVPTVVSVHSIWSGFPTVPLYRAGARVVGLEDAPVIWLPNSELTATAVRKVIDSERVRVQNNSVDAAGWQVAPIPHEGLVAVSATRFAPRKRVPELLEILRDAGHSLGINGPLSMPRSEARKDSRTANASETSLGTRTEVAPGAYPLRVVIAGEGSGLESAERFIESNGMTGWVSLPGRLDKADLVNLYAQSDIYLSPSVKDAFSISGLEARAAGLAILSRSQSGFGAAVHDGVEGRSVATDQEMTSTLVEWAREPEAVEAYKRHNRQTPMPYTWDHALPQFKRHYEDAAELRNLGRH